MEGEEKRARWGHMAEYLLCTIGFAVGYGSIWRFPYVLHENGGGAFLVPYFLTLAFVGIPLFFIESSAGQIFQRGVSATFTKIHEKYQGLGVCQVIICFAITVYYNLLLAYSLVYLWDSFKHPLPWITEDSGNGKIWDVSYFYDKILHLTPDISEIGTINTRVLIGNVVAFVVVYICIAKGIKTSGKIAYVTVLAPYVLSAGLLLRGLFLEGSGNGISYLFTIDLSKLTDPTIWYNALNQVFFQFGISVGVLYATASHKEEHSPITKSVYIINVVTAFTGIWFGITVFSYMGHMAEVANVPIEEIPLSGPELIFVAYPAALTLMPGANLWSIIFFVCMLFLGIDSQFALIEGVSGHFEDNKIKIFGKVWSPEMYRLGVILLNALVGFIFNFTGGFHFMEVFDQYATVVPLMVAAVGEVYIFTKIYSIEKLEAEVHDHTGERFPAYVVFALRYILAPVLILLIVCSFYIQIFVQLAKYPYWVYPIAILLMTIPISFIAFYYKKYKDIKHEGPYAKLIELEPLNGQQNGKESDESI